MLDTLRRATSDIEQAATDALAGLGPWLAPIPSAALVTRASVTHLGWSQPIGLVAGAIIEVLGLTATSTALALWDYNEGRRKTDKAAPFGLAAALVGFYYVSTIGLTVLLDIAPTLSRYAPALFPTLALVGTVNLALRAQHRRRLTSIAQEKAERAAQRVHKNTVQDDSRSAQEGARSSVLDAVNRTRREKKVALLSALESAYRDDPGLGATEAARRLGVHRNTIYGYTAELEATGRVRRNGNGVEVLS